MIGNVTFFLSSMILNAKKCAEYFPTEEGTSLFFEGDVSVLLKRQEQFPFPFETKVKVMVRQLEVAIPNNPTHTCLHYHWMDWPDRGVPEADLAPIALLSKLKENTTPIIVHCSAGIGRTGSIVLIQHAMELLHQPAPLVEISTYLMELRKQRNNSIQIAKKSEFLKCDESWKNTMKPSRTFTYNHQ
ncbi:Protein-tyrosine phosphatase [Dictyocaulus viviparus]|uniref:Protein-tyrosine phosphatase n=1 Tax=Dictyocaulus viviparus TaxID=29172 RepID=A0A0D8X701_DICVI|nr:Protein-tyrosine phosphatase [Dictyocaulus viviparus]